MIEIGELRLEVFGPADQGGAERYALEVAQHLGDLLRKEAELEVDVTLLEVRVGPERWPPPDRLARQLRDEVCKRAEAP